MATLTNKKPNISKTVESDLCCGCGVCTNACPFGAITMHVVSGEFRPSVDVTKCHNQEGCHRCYDTCAGLGITANQVESPILAEQYNPLIGHFQACFSAHAADDDLRFHAASGGTLSAFLIWLLEQHEIDGAVLTRFNPSKPTMTEPFLATTPQDILSAKSSKYAPVALDSIAQLIKRANGSRYVVVGLPCHTQSIRKLLNIDAPLRRKVMGLFSLYCSGTRTFLFTDYIFRTRKINRGQLTYLAYRDNGCLGGMVARGKDLDFYEPYQSYSHPLRSMFYPNRCLLCADHLGEWSDVSFGDLHVKPYSDDKIGVNSVITRSECWNRLLRQAGKDGAIVINPLDPDVLLQSQKMAYVKKSRNLAFCAILKRKRKPYPEYDYPLPAVKLRDRINYMQISVQRFIGRHKGLWWLIPLFKAKVRID